MPLQETRVQVGEKVGDGEEEEEEEKSDGEKKKKKLWAKGSTESVEALQHTLTHVPVYAAPGDSVVLAADVGEIQAWPKEKLESLDEQWAWINGLPKLPGKSEEWAYLNMLKNMDAVKESDMNTLIAALKTYAKGFGKQRSKANALLHSCNLKLRTLEAASGGPALTDGLSAVT